MSIVPAGSGLRFARWTAAVFYLVCLFRLEKVVGKIPIGKLLDVKEVTLLDQLAAMYNDLVKLQQQAALVFGRILA